MKAAPPPAVVLFSVTVPPPDKVVLAPSVSSLLVAEPPLITICPAFEIRPRLTVSCVLRLKDSLSSESMVRLLIASEISSATDEAAEFPPSMNTLELEMGTPPVHVLPLLQFPVPPFHVSVCPKAMLERPIQLNKTR